MQILMKSGGEFLAETLFQAHVKLFQKSGEKKAVDKSSWDPESMMLHQHVLR